MTLEGLNKFRLGYAAADHTGKRNTPRREINKRTTCTPAQIYQSPKANDVVQASDEVTAKWDSSCFDTEFVDIYLYSYASLDQSTSSGIAQVFKKAANSGGSYNLGKLEPSWWNNTADANLNLGIVEADTPQFMLTPGPIFSIHATPEQLATATSKAAAVTQTKTAADGSITTTTDSDGLYQTAKLEKPPGLSKGAIAAAIVVPIVVVGFFVGLYIKFARMKEREKRKRWSEHVDRRMSTISGDWSRAGGSAAGGPGGVRSSMISNGTRATSVYFSNGDARGSIYSVANENNMAGAGAGGGKRIPRVGVNGNPSSEMRQSQLRQSIFNASQSDVRQSRISFADDVRKSRVSFSDAGLRPTKSNMSGSTTNNNGAGPRRAISQIDGERHSIDNSRLVSARISRKLDDDRDFAVSPTQAAGPSNIPAVPALPEKKAGIFSALSSAVGLKDKKATSAYGDDNRRDIEQYDATRRSEEAVRNMEDKMFRRSQMDSQYSTQGQDANGRHYNNRHEGDDNSMEDLAVESDPVVPSSSLGAPTSTVRATSPMGMAMAPNGMNPDQLLAAYAAARVKSSTEAAEAAGSSGASPSHLQAPEDNTTRQSVLSDASAYSNAGPTDSARR
ncbi:hypothetical protein FFLO_04143 [Filobasidium floriforme]|uniref:Uncharacterized protein n=1 Tax=Filobasidium floriforme TaxID=5210 RepID=A0A8K0JJS1_9TREE|nr:uncharacterized protein HD553DRAFT_310061 [Filobasidium floriforme]KAG7531701.1 hypothetical protein FFLO_04143 [Filobasidium floriforme]KAH8085698.1 hypothetical protein HD553DRAFT_310061 [Filobasidium floriforme]